MQALTLAQLFWPAAQEISSNRQLVQPRDLHTSLSLLVIGVHRGRLTTHWRAPLAVPAETWPKEVRVVGVFQTEQDPGSSGHTVTVTSLGFQIF
jgi:hypothetical protein